MTRVPVLLLCGVLNGQRVLLLMDNAADRAQVALLRMAQIEMFEGGADVYLWAAFSLVGDWEVEKIQGGMPMLVSISSATLAVIVLASGFCYVIWLLARRAKARRRGQTVN